MLGGLWNFVKRHRKKFIVTGIVIGGIYYCGRYAERKLKEYREREQLEFLLCARKQQHFLSTQLTYKGTISSLIGNLRNSLCKKTDIDSLLSELKNKPVNKLEIWEQLKLLGLTELVSAVYACCILVLSLNVQINLIAGKLFQNTISKKHLLDRENFSETILPSDAQERYLSKIKEFLDDGLDGVLLVVRAAVSESVSEMTLRDPVSITLFQGIIASIRKRVEVKKQNGYHDYIPFSLVHFMKFLEPDNLEELQGSCRSTDQTDIQAKTFEILNGCDFQATSNICLDWCFNYLVKRFEIIFEEESSASICSNGKLHTKPLAKIIPLLNKEMLAMLSDQPNQFFMELLENTCLNNFAYTIYNQACKDEFSIE